MTKHWYESKTIWTNVVSLLAGAVVFFGLDMAAEIQAEIVAAILCLVNAANIVLRKVTKTAIR